MPATQQNMDARNYTKIIHRIPETVALIDLALFLTLK